MEENSIMKNLFISKSTQVEKFAKMVKRISDITEIDPKSIRKSCERILNEWEEKNHKEISALFHVSDRDKHDELHKIVKMFQRTLGGKIESDLILKKVGTVAKFWLEDLFYPF